MRVIWRIHHQSIHHAVCENHLTFFHEENYFLSKGKTDEKYLFLRKINILRSALWTTLTKYANV